MVLIFVPSLCPQSTIASSPSLSHLPSFFPPPPPSSLPSSIPKPKAPPASSIPSAATAPQVLVDHLRTLQHENTLLRSLLSNESGKIDLAKVVQRMKLLMRENEELEERVMRVQEGDGEVKMEGMETDAEEGLREGEGEEELRRAVDGEFRQRSFWAMERVEKLTGFRFYVSQTATKRSWLLSSSPSRAPLVLVLTIAFRLLLFWFTAPTFLSPTPA